jgi:hypothetical protein
VLFTALTGDGFSFPLPSDAAQARFTRLALFLPTAFPPVVAWANFPAFETLETACTQPPGASAKTAAMINANNFIIFPDGKAYPGNS